MVGSFRGTQLLAGVIVALWIFPFATNAQQSGNAVQDHFLAAQRDQQQGRLDEAAREYETVLRLQPGIPEVYANLGLVYYAQAKFAESARAFTEAAKLRPGMRGVDLWHGIDDVKLYRPAEAVALLREAVRQDPDNRLAQIWLGTALWDADQTDAALAQLRGAAAHFRDDADLLFALGEAYGKAVHQETEQLLADSAGTALSDRIYGTFYAQEHDWAKAEGHLRRAIERAPHSVDARLELADAFLTQGRLADAQQEVDQAATVAPHSAAVAALNGEILLLTGHAEQGLSRLANGLAIDRGEALNALGLPVEGNFEQAATDRAGAQFAARCGETAQTLQATSAPSDARTTALAALYARAGNEEASLRAFRDLASTPTILPTAASPVANAMEAYDLHRYDEAETGLLQWLSTHASDLDARYDLLLVRRRLAMQQISRLLTIAPESYHVHQLLGQLYVDRDEDEKALKEYSEVAEKMPNLPDVHFWLGHLYWKHGDADHATAELTRELQLDPNHAEANAELGAVLVAEDRSHDAIPHLELAIHSKPDLWPAYSQLGRAYANEKNYARAEEALKPAIAHDPDGSAHYQLGLVLRAEGKSKEAALAFNQLRAIKNEKMASSSGDSNDAVDKGATP